MPHDHKTYKYKICTCTPKLSSQNVVFIGYDILIGCFLSMTTSPKNLLHVPQYAKGQTSIKSDNANLDLKSIKKM